MFHIEHDFPEDGEWIVQLECQYSREHFKALNETLSKDQYFRIIFKYDYGGFCGYAFKQDDPVVPETNLLLQSPIVKRSYVHYYKYRTIHKIKSHRAVKSIVPNHHVKLTSVQRGAQWNLGRLCDPSLPPKTSYHYDSLAGMGVNAYVIDTGIQINHVQFSGRAKFGADFASETSDAYDPNGHGTHVAGTIGSRLYGIAKKIDILSVRVLNSDGNGRWSRVIAGIQFAVKHCQSSVGKRCVINLSVAGTNSQTLNEAVKAAVDSGLVVTIAAGNSGIDASTVSPANTHYDGSITVGSSNSNDEFSVFSNHGKLVEIIAPGEGILSTYASRTSNHETKEMFGTSMASPHVAGIAALMLARNPEWTPAQVEQEIMLRAAQGKINQIKGVDTENKLLQTYK